MRTFATRCFWCCAPIAACAAATTPAFSARPTSASATSEPKTQRCTWSYPASGAITYFRYQGVKAEHTYTQFEEKPRFDEVEEIANRYIEGFISGKIDRVEVAYMKFLNAARQTPVVETLLPLSRSAPGEARQPAPRPVEYEFLPSAADILQELLPVSFKVRLFKCFLDAAVSEQIARRVTMKQATENADDMIKSLTRLYNRARQAQITKEIAEVIGGAAALE